VIATDGEAGIDGRDPAATGPLGQQEQIASAAIVGVQDPEQFVRGLTAMTGPAIGVASAVASAARIPNPRKGRS
jgi:hypothetical protein